MAEITSEVSQGLLAGKLRSVRKDDTPASFKDAPKPASSNNPLEDAVTPTLVQNVRYSDVLPHKRIVTQEDMDQFHKSPALAELLGMIRSCNESVRDRKLTDSVEVGEAIHAVLCVLEQVHELVLDTPRDTDSASTTRFGNPAFRKLYEKIRQRTDGFMESLPGLKHQPRARQELAVYFYESWGNAKRIDYGSGMELNFVCWLLLLVKLGVLQLPRDGAAVVLRVFWRYITVMREIQSTYWLEPAGSHGVWGLDDYHFLPFLWGASQLSGHRFLRPKSIHDADLVEECARDYMYFACIQSINSIKTESLRWHSPMLDDISSVKTWSKVNEGMIKMYRTEVLSKLPIAQHIYFGTLLDFGAPETSDRQIDEDQHGHLIDVNQASSHGAHSHGEGQAAGWGDCCGIPIPSVFAAAEQAKNQPGEKRAIRRVPFD
ncbi:Serine/threonine-protein phosphatase 2A activator 2 [Malassezia yamatoensis]|uniref:Serine/threonine-protein phosphatase 2A activator n=1 Tax=Malassezia yamatoensis TaxID=253288 RepID=A0AAJ6CJH5_9BASI|nr:Serine/threonine-protein phosphatase 2A activator 2 [Malassezia yamatoensis]